MSEIVHEFGSFRLLSAARELWRGDRRVALPRRTFECLECLIAHRDRAVGRDELVAALFHRPDVSDAQLGQVVLRTRRAVDDDGNAQHTIRTIAGFGYRWVAPTTTRPNEPSVSREQHDAPTETEPRPASAPAGDAIATGASRLAVLAQAPPRRRVIAATVAFAAICVLAFAWWQRAPREARMTATSVGADGTLVLPLEIDGLREDGWVRLGGMDLVADRLREAGLRVPPSENVLGLLSGNGAAAPDPGRLRDVTGARLLVRGKAVHEATGWRVDLAATPARGIAVPVSASGPDAMQAARAATDQLLAALGRSLPPALENDIAGEALQRARAAMLANELDTARSILRASAALAGQPDQLAFRLATVDVRAGRLDAAEAALTSVLAHAPTAADAHFHADVLTARGSVRMRRGAFDAGGRDFDAALALLGTGGPALARGTAQLGRANSRVAAHRYEEALADFGAARVALESAGDALGVTRVDANLGMLELDRGRPAAALGYLSGAADRFQSFGALHELLLTLTGLMQAQLAMLQRDAAWATVERASALRARITDPDQRVDLLLDRAEVLLGFGRHHEAGEALEQAQRIATSGNRVLLARSRWIETRLAAARAQWTAVAVAAGQALQDWPSSGADGDRAGVLLLQQRALLALGRTEDARALFDRTRTPPPQPDAHPGEVDEALAMAEWAGHVDANDAAAAWYRFALASAERSGVPAQMVAVAHSQAPRLLAAGARDGVIALVGRVAPWAEHDFDSALLQLALFRALDQHDAWFHALRQAQALAGERPIPPHLMTSGSASPSAPLRLGAVP